MFFFFLKKLYKKTLLKKKKIIPIWSTSITINSFLVNKYVKSNKGLFFRVYKPNKYMIGMKSGEYISTRKLYNKPTAFQKRR